MTQNSLLLLAVKNCMKPNNQYLKGGNNFSSYYSISSLAIAEVYSNKMHNYINSMISDFSEDFDPSIRYQAVDSLKTADIFESYKYDDESALFCSTAYNSNIGKFSLYAYTFHPNDDDTVHAESMHLSIDFKLADIIVLVTCAKGGFGSIKIWSEVRYVKAALQFIDVVNVLSIALAPIFSSGIQAPKGLTTQLKEMAESVPDTIPSDAPRRTVFNPITKTYNVVTDPQILKLIPGKWEYITSTQVEEQMRANSMLHNTLSSKWEFDQ